MISSVALTCPRSPWELFHRPGFENSKTDQRLRVLVVCTANVCRSPVSAMLLDRALLKRDVDAIVESGGFYVGGAKAPSDRK